VDNFRKDNIIRLLSLLTILFILFFQVFNIQKPAQVNITTGNSISPTPFNPFPYKIPQITYKRAYLIMLVGDSMVASLGPNANLVRQHLIELYPTHEFVNYNYGFGATSIETLPDRLTKETLYNGQKYQSILSQGFDLIIIESFAYNPLSQTNSGEGLAKHMLILDESIKKIIKERPGSALAIMTPIAPKKPLFAKGVYDLSTEERIRWANERISYIERVVDYANENKIPLINVYEKSLTPEGDGNLKYINKDDYIHPSAEGVDFMSKVIADFIFENNIFPE